MTATGGTALVLSGGGARGAYEAGVVAGVVDLLGPAAPRPLFGVVTGTSVGAMNAAHIAAHVDRADLGVPALLDHWSSLDVATHLRPRLGALLGRHLGGGRAGRPERWGRSLLDPRPFEALFDDGFPWERLHRNVDTGVLRALVISALNVATGKTVSFVELAPDGRYVPSRDPRRDSRLERITADHVVASAAIPLIFPARRVGSTYYCDGGLRFNTPMAPAIRAGADRLLVVALRAGATPAVDTDALASYPNPVFLLGKVLDALLLDPIEYDLQVLQRLNRVLEVLDDAASPTVAQRVAEVLDAERGLAYRRVETLVLRPSLDIGVLALQHLQRRGVRASGAAAGVLLQRVAALGARVEADFLSYILFDADFARALIALGRADVLARAEEVRSFFRVARHRFSC
jgi:NTE family protein